MDQWMVYGEDGVNGLTSIQGREEKERDNKSTNWKEQKCIHIIIGRKKKRMPHLLILKIFWNLFQSSLCFLLLSPFPVGYGLPCFLRSSPFPLFPMVPLAHLDRSSFCVLLPDVGFITCHAGNGSRKPYGALSRSLRNNVGSVVFRYNGRHAFGSLLEHFSALHKRKENRTEVCVAADFSDSKPETSSYLGDLGYHPLEDISSFEKKNSEQPDRRLTDAEIARTLTEVNENAVIFASLWNEEDHIFGTEVQFLVDEHGDFFFQIDDDSEFLATLNSAGKQMNVAIGYDNIEDWILEQQEVQDEIGRSDSEDDAFESDEGSDEDEEQWTILTSDGTEFILEELDEDSSESIGDWSGLDTLQSIHPLDFADALSSAALADNDVKIEKPSQSLRIVGEVYRLHGEEEKYVEQLFRSKFGDDEENDDTDIDNENDGDGEANTDDGGQVTNLAERASTGHEDQVPLIRISTSSGSIDFTKGFPSLQHPLSSNFSEKSMLWPSEAGIGDSDDDIREFEIELPMDGDTGSDDNKEEESRENEPRVAFYKLDIQTIHVISFFHAQCIVDKVDFQMAKPDILARTGPEIIERLNARGKVLEDALKSACLRRKGLEVEEVSLLSLDSLGMDLRVHCGREVKTLRISFSQQATTEEHAEQLLNDLLFPEIPLRGRRKRRTWT